MKSYTIKNNIVLFSNSCLSQWYGAFKGQENGQFKITWDTAINFIAYGPMPHARSYDETFQYAKLKEIHCNCAEQAMMFSKALLFNDMETAEKILNAKQPAEQKKLGREVKNYDDAKWNGNKFYIVCSITKAKFEQNPELKEILTKELKNYIIAEAAPWDKVWGIGLAADNPKAWDVTTWEGENLLGKALMKVREELS